MRLSTIGAEPGASVAFWDWHGRIDQHLQASGVATVLLRSSFYMSNLLAAAEPIAREGRLYAPADGAKIAMIDPRDVAAVAATVLTSGGHDGQTYVLTGPEAITYSEVAEELSAATGRRVEFVKIPDEAARQGMVAAGLPEFVAEQVVKIFGMLRRGAAEEVTQTVESLTGDPPRSFAAFTRDHSFMFDPLDYEEEAER